MPYGAPNGIAGMQSVRNAFINGDMMINQIRPVASAVSYAFAGNANVWNNVDNCGLFTATTATAVVDDSQEADHPILGSQGFCKSILCTTPDAVINAAEYAGLFMTLEGPLLQSIFNQTTVLSFWVKSPKSGVHCVAFQNAGSTFSYVAEYTVFQANTWEQKLIGISFATNPAQFIFTESNIGVRLHFPLFCGTTFHTQNANQWQVANVRATANQQNLLDTAGNTFRITDVQLETGVVNTAFDREAFDTSLIRCRRYYQQTFPYGVIPANNAGFVNQAVYYACRIAGVFTDSVFYLYSPPMCQAAGDPDVVFYNPGSGGGANWWSVTRGANSGNASRLQGLNKSPGVCLTNSQAVADAPGHALCIHATFDARI